MKSQPRPRSLFRIIFGRTTFVILGLLLQIAFFFSIFRWLGNYIHFVYICCHRYFKPAYGFQL